MNLHAQLEAQLSQVVVGEVVATQAVKPSVSSQEKREAAPPSVATRNDAVQILSSIRELDARLVAHVTSKSAPTRRRLSVRVAEHEASPHVVALGGLARKLETKVREPEWENVQAWTAPYEEPPSIDTMAGWAADLYLDRVEPALWLEQFTPGDIETAFGESYGLWSRIRAPFIRWERAEHAYAAEPSDEVEPLITDVEPEEQVEEPEERVPMLYRMKRSVVEAFAKAKDREEALIAEIEQEWGAPILVPRVAPARVMAGFFALLLFVTLPAGAVSLSRSVGSSWLEVSSSGQEALSAAERAGASPTDPAAWGRVSQSLSDTDQALNRVNALAVGITQALPETRNAYSSARNLLHAGDASAQAALLLTQGLDRALGEPTRYPVDRGRVFKTYLDSAAPLLDDANLALSEVKLDSLPESERAKATEATTLLTTVRQAVGELRSITDLLMTGAGDLHRRSYLFVFQNSTELRPTGGFMGSLALITLDRGEIKALEVPGGGPYDLKGELKERVRPPEPLRLVAQRWEFQDANWFPDFPAAAEKLQWFWSKSGQPSIDGVVAVNLRVLERLLEVTGPVELPEYGKTITSENVWMEMQKAVELEYDKEENKPKKIVGDLMAKLLERLKSSDQDQWVKLLSLGAESLETKDIQVWLSNPEEEALVERFGWSGRFKETPGDSLAVIGANIAGQKSDRLINERVDHTAEIQEDGSIVDTVTITRTHTGTKGDLFTGVNNVTYLRVYVPKGAELLSADGFSPPPANLFKQMLEGDPEDADLAAVQANPRLLPNGVQATDEFGRTAFGGWVQLEPGQSKVTTFKYRLPFGAFDIAQRLRPEGAPRADAIRPAYTALYTSQSGKPERTLTTKVTYPKGWNLAWSHADGLDANMSWDRDRATAGLFLSSADK
ncbi:DUF4012 domain-containing protein [Patescibacteria group bacterium]|nr:DUF4012 domain-containing protein [Patescibacteria group bacterium]